LRAEEKLDKSFWQTTLGGGAVLYNPSYLARMNEKEAISFVHLLESVLALYFSKFKSKNNDAESKGAFSAAVVFVLAHASWQVRREAVRALARLHAQLPGLADVLTPGALKFLRDASASSATLAQSPQVLATALHSVVSASLSESLLPQVFAAAHLPYVDAQAWAQVAKTLGKPSNQILEKEETTKAVVTYLISAEALLSKVEICFFFFWREGELEINSFYC
jgi:hypothetical protein